MSRLYAILLEISAHRPEAIERIQQAAAREWPFCDWTETAEKLSAYGEGLLCGGEREEEFTGRLAAAIWHANGVHCDVVVTATYFECLPSQTHCLGEDDYVRLIRARSENLPQGDQGGEGEAIARN